MNIQIKTSNVKSWGKNKVVGEVIGYNSKGKQVQEVLEKIYYIGYLRIILRYNFKFKQY